MAASSHAQHYLREAVLTATQEQLQLMLYDGAIRFTMQGRDALTKKDYERVFNCLSRAQNIVMEMYNGLNHQVNPDLCERVGALYMFIYNKLVDGSARHDVQALDDALKILRMERETWQILVEKVASERATAAPAAAASVPGVGATLCVDV